MRYLVEGIDSDGRYRRVRQTLAPMETVWPAPSWKKVLHITRVGWASWPVRKWRNKDYRHHRIQPRWTPRF